MKTVKNLIRRSSTLGPQIEPDEQLQKWADTLKEATQGEVGIVRPSDSSDKAYSEQITDKDTRQIKGTWSLIFQPILLGLDDSAVLDSYSITNLVIDRTTSGLLGSRKATLARLQKGVRQEEWGRMIAYAKNKSSSHYGDTHEVKVQTTVGIRSYDLHFELDESVALPDGKIKIAVVVSRPGDLAGASGNAPEGSDLTRQTTGASASSYNLAESWSMGPPVSDPSNIEQSISNEEASPVNMSDSGLLNRDSLAPVLPDFDFPESDFGFSLGGTDSSVTGAAVTGTQEKQPQASPDTVSVVSREDLLAGQVEEDNTRVSVYAPYVDDEERDDFGATYVPVPGSRLELSFSGSLPLQQTEDGSSS